MVLVIVNIKTKVHIIEDLKANILIKNNIIIFENIIVNLVNKRLIIGKYKGIIIYINIVKYIDIPI